MLAYYSRIQHFRDTVEIANTDGSRTNYSSDRKKFLIEITQATMNCTVFTNLARSPIEKSWPSLREKLIGSTTETFLELKSAFVT